MTHGSFSPTAQLLPLSGTNRSVVSVSLSSIVVSIIITVPMGAGM